MEAGAELFYMGLVNGIDVEDERILEGGRSSLYAWWVVGLGCLEGSSLLMIVLQTGKWLRPGVVVGRRCMRIPVSSGGDGYICGMRLFPIRRQVWRTQDGHSVGASKNDARSKCRWQQQH